MNRSRSCTVPICCEDSQTMDELRIVLFGRQDVHKEKLKEVLTNKELFTSKDSSNVVVVNTPDLFKREEELDDVLEKIKRSLKQVKPGPHVFLFVERFDEMEQEKTKALSIFVDTFGEQALDFTMMVFTTDDQEEDEAAMMGNLDQFSLRKLTRHVDDRYFIFNVADIEHQQPQVTELQKKMKQMRKNCYLFYSQGMLEQAEKALGKKEKEASTTEAEWRSFYDRCGVIGTAVGTAIGYVVGCRGELTSTTGAAIGGVAGMILFMATAFLVVLAKFKIKKKFT
ncbi:GTPase IMAP family member 9 [Haplochromis burtoni]|uniref:GTPase IMAP family member 4-like n=1 Tax=Haplochromis burtoni TaxID=8153 RepID=A0A3Q2VK67_HAPBU|nr:GTPase IMAP family member 9 [Haplochromis burtoni]